MERNHVEVWNNCLAIIRDNISHQSFKTWFEPIIPVKLEDNVLTIQVPSHFFYEWLEENYIDLLKKTIKKELGNEGRLEYSIVMDSSNNNSSPYVVKATPSNKKALKNPSVSLPLDISHSENKVIPNPFIIPGLKKVNIDTQLNEAYSFDTFVEGDCNRLARSAGLAVSNSPGKTVFNPLFLQCSVGLGKTHLSNAIGIQVKQNFPEKTVLYVTADTFQRQFMDAVKNNNQNDFIHFYQMIDVLIIDDIHDFAGKTGTQNIFFQIFNHMYQSGKQLVLTSDKPPVELQGIEDRLLSRFKWGLYADMQAPDYETRLAILEKKAYACTVEMPREVLEYLAQSITNNIREMEGALNSVIAQSSLNKKNISLELARQIIDKYVKTSCKEFSIEYIQKVVCDYFNVSIDTIHSKSRKREIVQARQLAMYFSKKMTKSSLAVIGMHCGNKDHATVLHACRAVNNLIETDKQFKAYVDEIEERMRQ